VVDLAALGLQLYLTILKVFSKLNDSMILFYDSILPPSPFLILPEKKYAVLMMPPYLHYYLFIFFKALVFYAK